MTLAHVTLSDTQGYAIFALSLGALVVGFFTRRAASAFLPLLVGAGFLGATVASDDLYSRIPEDVQIMLLAACMLGIAMALVGVVVRRILDSELERRRAARLAEPAAASAAPAAAAAGEAAAAAARARRRRGQR